MYTFSSRARYTEINHQQGIMAPSSIINYFQDCSTFQSEDLNIGLTYLQEKHRIWLLNSWQLELIRPIRLADYLTIGTWPYGFKGIYGYRNFIMKSHTDELLAVANSVWVYMDYETGTPLKVPKDNAGYILEPPYPMDYMDRKINITGLTLTPLAPFPVVKSNIDSYNHVNNGQYIKMAEEFLPKNFSIRRMRVEYRQQAVAGEIIHPYVLHQDKDYYVVLSDATSKPYAIIQFTEAELSE